MRKFTQLEPLIIAIFLLTGNAEAAARGGWVSSLKAGMGSFAGRAGGSLLSAGASEGQLMVCRRMASVPGGMNSMAYQQSCGNAAFLCQQQAMINPGVMSDPYCAMVSGTGGMIGPWGGSVSPMMVGMTPPSPSMNPGGPNAGWGGVPAPIPYGMMGGFGTGGGMLGGGGVMGTLEGLGEMAGMNFLGSFMGGGMQGGMQNPQGYPQQGYNNYQGGYQGSQGGGSTLDDALREDI